MPGYLIHLAVAQTYIKKHSVNNIENFIKGTITPDILKKQSIDSHFGSSKNPDFSEFFQKYKLCNDYEKGYFLHLVTDYFFYNNVITSWSRDIYKDYNFLSFYLIDKYNLAIPKEISSTVKFCTGTPKILNIDAINEFIQTTSDKSVEEYYKIFIKKI